MHKTIKAALATTVLAAAFAAAPAFADEAPPVVITGSATLATDYNLRGISQTNATPAVQGGVTATSSVGAYVGLWGSNLAGNGSWGGSNMELDVIGGYSHAVGTATLDGGVIYYVYPGTSGHDFIEFYGSASAPLGPVKGKLGFNYTPAQRNAAPAGQASSGNNIWIYTDLALPIAGTPLTAKGHVGYSSGDSIYTYGADVVDYGFGVDASYKALTLNVSYVGTDMKRDFANANFGAGTKSGHAITRGRVVASLTAAF